MAKQEILMMEKHGAINGVPQMQDEITHYKERFHSEKHSGDQRHRELEAMEAKGATLKRTLQHDDCKLIQMQALIEKEREKMQAHVQNRYWQIAQTEDAQSEVDQLMTEKQDLVKKKRDLKDQVQHLEDKQREILQTLQLKA